MFPFLPTSFKQENNFQTAKVLVLGDSSVGKTSLLHFICTGEILDHPKATIGCDISLKEIGGKLSHRQRFVEFWEVGGHPSFHISRSLFYDNAEFDGVVLVHDLSKAGVGSLQPWLSELEKHLVNPQQHTKNLPVWSSGCQELQARDCSRIDEDEDLAELEIGLAVGTPSFPLLVLGNKLDLAESIQVIKWNQRAAQVDYTMLAVSAKTGFVESRQLMGFFDQLFEHQAAHSAPAFDGGNCSLEDDTSAFNAPELRRRFTDDNFELL